MITTITLNPSVDRRYIVDDFKVGSVFKTSQYEATAGGKGLNVSRVVASYNEQVLATGLIGGKSGEFIKGRLQEVGVPHQFVPIKEETRSCIAIVGNNYQTEILETGPTVTESEIGTFLVTYQRLVQTSSIIVASGSIPNGVPFDIYSVLIKKARDHNVPFFLDTSGLALGEAIQAGPTLIKPNLDELASLVGFRLTEEEDIIQAAKHLSMSGIEYVVVSLGADGVIAFHHDQVYKLTVPKVKVINPVGSGDSMMAGLAIAFQRQYNFSDSLRLATAFGTANAMAASTAHVDKNIVNQLQKNILVQ
ncbi:1-phosphofructokinase [Bacillus sp. HMF5848]|uniref:1-phosphofructokinase n=1 Tax=Bacillus sp. HMF5848 TaxID=2495421 RepID=UPI000F7BAD44|nr:1-phosphofructokinase [Bacillus sp. HMF5848]RSK28792.1 1-phosphofructokinase [Bacillus sp. HMF5848]